MRFRARPAVSPTGEASGTRQGDGRRFQKKIMKSKNLLSEAAPASVCPADSKMKAVKSKALVTHCANRGLTTEKVLELLRTKFPRQYEFAEIVGRWIWLDASGRNHAEALWKLGFHWNRRRAVWQHPCGAFAPFSSHSGDPRRRYGSRFASDSQPI
jgi:hypothetical protein